MKVNYQIYGLLLFVGLIILILLLNKNSNNMNPKSVTGNYQINEGFENQIDNYEIMDNSFFDLGVTPWKNMNLEEALQKCSDVSSCIGITRKKNTNGTDDNETFPILKKGPCHTNFVGGPLQKSKAQNYKSYIKKLSVGDVTCLNEKTIENYFSFTTKNNLYWCVDNKDKTLKLLSAPRIAQNKLFSKANFKIVTGLFAEGSVSIQVSKTLSDAESSEPTYYIVHDYPKQENLFLKEIGENESDWKKKASFKMIPGLTKEGFTLKIIGFTDMYFKYIGENMTIGTVNDSEKEKATFFTILPISEDASMNYLEEKNETELKNVDLSPHEKFLKMKNKNLLSLEKQQMMLEEQNKKINNFQFMQIGNIGRVSREFANQSAELALSKYLKEKESIDEIAKKNKTIDNSPSVNSLKK
jgi:hypothetical protein